MFRKILLGLVLFGLLFSSVTYAAQSCPKGYRNKAGVRVCDITFTSPTFINQCTATLQGGIYTITNNTPVAITITSIALVSNDSFPASAAVVVAAPSNNCTVGGSLAAGASCNIQVNLQPLQFGTFNRTLTVGINTREGQGTAPAITTVVNCGSASPIAPPVPVPAGADLCTILGAATVTNTGPTLVTGFLCLNPGTSVTGFPPGTITGNGGLPNINDARAIAAKSAAQSLFTSLNALPCTVSAAQQLGNLTLTPGVYCFSSSALLTTGPLTLSGAGNYVFLIPSTLTTSQAVILTNGADAHNIYWNVGSSATLGIGTALQGRIIAQASITFDTGATLVTGSASALTAAVTLDTNTVTQLS